MKAVFWRVLEEVTQFSPRFSRQSRAVGAYKGLYTRVTLTDLVFLLDLLKELW